MLLSENPEHESNYTPMQFENSLGKLQVGDFVRVLWPKSYFISLLKSKIIYNKGLALRSHLRY